MRYFMTLILLAGISSASIIDVNFFDADFKQTIIDEKGKVLQYSGHMKATKPHYVLWNYTKPIKKDIYISQNRMVIIEPEIEQVIIRAMKLDFNFFKMIKNAKQTDKGIYKTMFQQTQFIIKLQNKKLFSISYKDKFDNKIVISFTHQVQNKKISLSVFTPIIPPAFDIIQD